jgi:hypothetical protein
LTVANPLLQVQFDADRFGATDLLVFSHGWNNTPTVATRLYEAFFERVTSLLAAHGRSGRTVAYLGVYWPSIRWSDEPIPDFQPAEVVDLGAGTGGAAGSVGPPQEFEPPPPPDAKLAARIRASFPTEVRGEVDELLDLITARRVRASSSLRSRVPPARTATGRKPSVRRSRRTKIRRHSCSSTSPRRWKNSTSTPQARAAPPASATRWGGCGMAPRRCCAA